MLLLVTGGAGFVGSNFIRYILHAHPDWQVVNLDKLTYAGNPANLADVESDPRYRFVPGDIADEWLMGMLFRRFHFDAVVNFAAETHVDRSILEPAGFVETNVKGTGVLLEAARRHGIRRFVQISTDEVYGSLGPGETRFTEEHALAPNNPYSASKASADLLARAYFRTYGLPVVITRCCNNFGPYQFPEKFLPRMITCALEDRPLPVYGDGQNIRDWIHVEDHCRAIELVIMQGCPGETYNVGADCELRNIDVARAVLGVLGKPESLITYVSDRPGHDRRYAIDASKIRDELGWRPQRNFHRDLPGLVRWYQENQDWWRPLLPGSEPGKGTGAPCGEQGPGHKEARP